MPVIDATPATLEGYGFLVDDPASCKIEIVRWPAQGSRPVDADTGDQGGTTEGTFVSEWKGDILYGRNDAVGGHYILAYGEEPAPRRSGPRARSAAHPALARELPSGRRPALLSARQETVPGAARAAGRRHRAGGLRLLRFDGTHGLYIHPDIWHEGVFATGGTQRFFDQQGAVHARVSVDFAREFGCLLEAPIG